MCLTCNFRGAIFIALMYTICTITERSFIMELDKLKGKLTEKKRSYKDCADFLGIATSTFNLKINGKSCFDLDEAKKLSDFLELDDYERAIIFLH